MGGRPGGGTPPSTLSHLLSKPSSVVEKNKNLQTPFPQGPAGRPPPRSGRGRGSYLHKATRRCCCPETLTCGSRTSAPVRGSQKRPSLWVVVRKKHPGRWGWQPLGMGRPDGDLPATLSSAGHGMATGAIFLENNSWHAWRRTLGMGVGGV